MVIGATSTAEDYAIVGYWRPGQSAAATKRARRHLKNWCRNHGLSDHDVWTCYADPGEDLSWEVVCLLRQQPKQINQRRARLPSSLQLAQLMRRLQQRAWMTCQQGSWVVFLQQGNQQQGNQQQNYSQESDGRIRRLPAPRPRFRLH